MRKKCLSLVLTFAMLLSMIPVVNFGADAVVTENAKYDVFISADKQLGYNVTTLAALVDTKLAAMNISGGSTGITSDARIESTTVIDTTDLSSWYVYDHYNSEFWDVSANWPTGSTSKNDAWMKFYNKSSMTEVTRPASFITDPSATSSAFTTLENMVNTGTLAQFGLAHRFREHIYSYEDASGNPGMWFAGYASPAYADYLFYPTASTGGKNVKFSLNSQYVNTHSLNGAGFLINTGIDASGKIKGYILYYTFASPTTVSSLTLYKIKTDVLASSLNSGVSDISTYADSVKIVSNPTWNSLMDIELDITPTSLTVKQGISGGTKNQVMSETITNSGYNGFGPIVKYSGHGCPSSSVFKFSNLEMSFEGATGNSLLAGIEDSDYLKDSNVKKFFVNLVGSDYSASASDKDLAYLNILQDKKISLITNYLDGGTNYITNYLGTNSKNLNSLPNGNSNSLSIETYDIKPMSQTTDINKLAQDIAYYIYSETFSGTTGTPANPTSTTVAKLYLLEKSTDIPKQASIVRNELIELAGQKIYFDNTGTINAGTVSPIYSIIKPGAVTIETIAPVNDNDGKGPYFVVTNNKTAWPIGQYAVTLSYGLDSVPATTKFEIHQDVTAPSVSAAVNEGVVNLSFTNISGIGSFNYASDLSSFTVLTTSTTAIPTVDWTSETIIENNSLTAVAPITQNGFMHLFVKDTAGNIGHSYIEITQLLPIIKKPIASKIGYGQALSDSILTAGTATFNNVAVAGTFTWKTPTVKPEAGSTDYSVTFTPDSGLYAKVTFDVSISVEKAIPSIIVSDKNAFYTGDFISIASAVVLGTEGMSAPIIDLSYTYYTDVSCTTLTTPGNSGSLSNGSAPKYSGKYYVKATNAISGNYSAATTMAPATLIISPMVDGGLTIGSDLTKKYGDTSFQLVATGGIGTGVVKFTSSNPSIASVTENGYVTIKAVGMTTITATKMSDGNYSEQFASISLTVDKNQVSYSIINNTKPYNALPQFATVTPNPRSLVEDVDYKVTYKQGENVVTTPTNTGVYDIIIETLSENYVGDSTEGKLTLQAIDQNYVLQIGGLPVHNEFEDTFALYANGGNGTGDITWSVTSGDDFAKINTSGEVEIIGVGLVTITATKGSDVNYNEQVQSITFTTHKKQISLTISQTAKTYNGNEQAVTVTGTATKTDLKDILSISYAVQTDAQPTDVQPTFRNVGTYNVNVEIHESYVDRYVLNNLYTAVATIAKSNLTISADNKTKVYGEVNPIFTSSYTLNGTDVKSSFNEPTLVCTADEKSGVGDYEIVPSYDDALNSNYNVTLEKGVLSVNKAPLVVTSENKEIFYNEDAPKYSVNYSGFKVNDDVSNLEGNIEFECGYVKGAELGEFDINASGWTSNNYAIEFVKGKLTVSPVVAVVSASSSTSHITIYLSPVVSGLTSDNFVIKQGETVVTPTAITESQNGGRYTLNADLVVGKEYTVTFSHAPNYTPVTYTFTAMPIFVGTGGVTGESKTITVTQVSNTLFENAELIEVSADMKNAFNKSIEVKITADSLATQMFVSLLESGYKIHPFDISLYEKGSNIKVQPNSGFEVSICLPLPKQFWELRDKASIAYVSNGKIVTVPSKLVMNNDVWCMEFKAVHFSPYAIVIKNETEWTNPFSDVSENDWFYEAVKFVNSRGLMTGSSLSTFSPMLGTTRGMIVTILYRLEGEPAQSKPSNFIDVKSGTYYSNAVAWGEKNGIIFGYNAEAFRPNEKISREQMAVIFYAYTNYKKFGVSQAKDLGTFSDSLKTSAYALNSVKWMVADGLLSGTTETTLDPKGQATRAQLATILMKFLQKYSK